MSRRMIEEIYLKSLGLAQNFEQPLIEITLAAHRALTTAHINDVKGSGILLSNI